MYVLLATYDPLKLQVTGISFDSWICTKISAFLSALRTNTIISNPQPHMTTKKVHSHHSISNAHPTKYFTKAGRDLGRPQTTTFISPHTFTRPIRIVLVIARALLESDAVSLSRCPIVTPAIRVFFNLHSKRWVFSAQVNRIDLLTRPSADPPTLTTSGCLEIVAA